jgi:hypothetical protein
MKAKAVGLFVVAAFVAFIAWVVPDSEVRRPMWLFIFAMLAAIALVAWSHTEAPKTLSGWVGYICVAIVGGAVMTAIDVLFFVRAPAGVSLVDAALKSGWAFFDLLVIVGGTIVAAGGWAYSLTGKAHDR